MKSVIKIANTQAFWGDRTEAAFETLKKDPSIDYITLDYLAEVSMSIMATQKVKNPQAGYAKDFLDVLASVIPLWKEGLPFKIIANAGGLNPEGCGNACVALLKQMGIHKKIVIVDGDDAMAHRDRLRCLDDGSSIGKLAGTLVTANAYLGAWPIADALARGADIVITGRVADPSLAVAPCLFEFGWKKEDLDLLAQATVAGHLIECGTQATGGIFTDWLDLKNDMEIGYPIVEMSADGTFVLTKPKHTGGIVNRMIVTEQLLYELGNPARYISPDVTVSFLKIVLEEVGENRVKVTGAKGAPATNDYKVSATYPKGFQAEGLLVVAGPQAAEKGKRMAEIVLDNVKRQGYVLDEVCVECLGNGDLMLAANQENRKECLWRMAVADHREEAIACWAKQIAPLVTSGPQGVTGYFRARPKARKVFGFWPGLIAKDQLHPRVYEIGES